MTRVEYEGISFRDREVVVDLTVTGPDKDAEKIALDLRDRAYRAVQALDGRADHPNEAEPHPESVMWDDLAEGDDDVATDGGVDTHECRGCGATVADGEGGPYGECAECMDRHREAADRMRAMGVDPRTGTDGVDRDTRPDGGAIATGDLQGATVIETDAGEAIVRLRGEAGMAVVPVPEDMVEPFAHLGDEVRAVYDEDGGQTGEVPLPDGGDGLHEAVAEFNDRHDTTVTEQALVLAEETGEACEAVLARDGRKLFKPETGRAELVEELAHVIYTAYSVGERADIHAESLRAQVDELAQANLDRETMTDGGGHKHPVDMDDEELANLVRNTPEFRAIEAAARFADEANHLRVNDEAPFDVLVRWTHNHQATFVDDVETTREIIETFIDALEHWRNLSWNADEAAEACMADLLGGGPS